MLYDYKVKDYKGEEVSLSKYKNKVLLIVNSATKCGYTKQYDGLQELFRKYNHEGFEILDFPCNQFLHQAPGTSEEIHDACVLRFAIKFPQFEKINVNGKEEHPLYKYLKENVVGEEPRRIKWNFTKFLVDRNGTVVKRFEPADTPEEIEKYIKALL